MPVLQVVKWRQGLRIQQPLRRTSRCLPGLATARIETALRSCTQYSPHGQLAANI